MKKLALSSLIAVFAVSGAHAANVIDGNPLYMPKAGHFYSETALSSHTEGTPYVLSEDFGYGITDKLAVEVGTSLWENRAFDNFAWDNVSLKATFRALDMNGWKADLVAAYEAGANPSMWLIPGGGLYYHQKALRPADDNFWFDEDLTGYTWTAGVRGGYVASNWTVAGHAMFNYMNSESFNLGDAGMHTWNLGLDAQYVVCPKLSLVAGVEYTGVTNDHLAYDDVENPAKAKNEGTWAGMFGVNYNIDATKYVGVYVNGALNHQEGNNNDEWGWNDGFGFGAKFGIDF